MTRELHKSPETHNTQIHKHFVESIFDAINSSDTFKVSGLHISYFRLKERKVYGDGSVYSYRVYVGED